MNPPAGTECSIDGGDFTDKREQRLTEQPPQQVALDAIGVTLVAVLVGIAFTVALGLRQDWWIKLLAGLATPAVIAVGLKITVAKTGWLTRFAYWLTQR